MRYDTHTHTHIYIHTHTYTHIYIHIYVVRRQRVKFVANLFLDLSFFYI